MPSTTIDTLNVKITANAMDAAKALDSLANALKNVRSALNGTGSKGVPIAEKMAKSIHELNNAMTRINNDGIKKLQSMSNALNSYGKGLQRLGGGIGAAQKVKDIASALGGEGNATGNAANDTESSFADYKKTIDGYKESISGLSDTLKKLGEQFKGLGKNVKDAEKHVKKATKTVKKADKALGKVVKSVGRIAFYRAIRSAMRAVTEAFSEGLKNAYLFSAQSDNFKGLADTLDRLKSVTSQMTNQLGAFAGELIQFVAPALEWLAEKVRYLAERATELFAALNGKDKYEVAVYEQKRWDAAADSLKKYKQQLLGLDELNNLSSQEEEKEESDSKKPFELKDVSDKFKKLALNVNGVLGFLGDAFKPIKDLVLSPLGMTAIGALLIFTHHYALGLGLVFAGTTWGVSELILNWDELRGEVEKAFEKYKDLFNVTATTAAVGAVAVGALLIFTQHYVSGIACVLAGTSIGAATIALNWSELRKKVKRAFKKYKGLFNVTATTAAVGAVAVGALLLFTQHYVAGIACILAGTGIGAATLAFNWDSLLENVRNAFENVLEWLKNTFVPRFDKIKEYIQNPLGSESLELGDETLPAGKRVKLPSSNLGTIGAIITGLGLLGAGAGGGGKYFEKDCKMDFATGGVPANGTLFFAGEAGPEFIGSIGSSSAVANTEQMTDAIYRAAYMGMSRALQENGGMGGFEPATTDDLFIAMRKKASNFNKRTGESAFA